jgi:hypothetical protein
MAGTALAAMNVTTPPEDKTLIYEELGTIDVMVVIPT